jgi:hypothetical protein
MLIKSPIFAVLPDMLTELSRREKAANIKPDADIDAFMKVLLQIFKSDPSSSK